MIFKPKNVLAALSAAAMVVALGSQAQAQQRYTVGSLAEGTTPFIVNTAWANAINKYMPGHKVQVSAVGAATKHAILVAQGKMDFSMYAPIQYRLLYKQIGPYKKITNGPELTEKISQLFSYPIGHYHAVVYDDSGIKSFNDIKGKKVFLGPPAGVATRNTTLIVDAMTGYKPGEDFEQVKMGWGAAAQAFQDRKIDVWISVTTSPSPSVSQLTLSNKIRLLGLDESKFDHPSWKKYIAQPGRNLAKINPADYGPNMTNEEPVLVTGAIVGLAVRSDMDEELVYNMMRAFWDHQEEAHAMASFMHKTINLERAVESLAHPVHPGAVRFYKEKGIDFEVMDLSKPAG